MVSPNCAMLLRSPRRQYSFAADVPATTRQALGRFKYAEIMFKREAGLPSSCIPSSWIPDANACRVEPLKHIIRCRER